MKVVMALILTIAVVSCNKSTVKPVLKEETTYQVRVQVVDQDGNVTSTSAVASTKQ